MHTRFGFENMYPPSRCLSQCMVLLVAFKSHAKIMWKCNRIESIVFSKNFRNDGVSTSSAAASQPSGLWCGQACHERGLFNFSLKVFGWSLSIQVCNMIDTIKIHQLVLEIFKIFQGDRIGSSRGSWSNCRSVETWPEDGQHHRVQVSQNILE